MGLNPTQGINVCLRLLLLSCADRCPTTDRLPRPRCLIKCRRRYENLAGMFSRKRQGSKWAMMSKTRKHAHAHFVFTSCCYFLIFTDVSYYYFILTSTGKHEAHRCSSQPKVRAALLPNLKRRTPMQDLAYSACMNLSAAEISTGMHILKFSNAG